MTSSSADCRLSLILAPPEASHAPYALARRPRLEAKFLHDKHPWTVLLDFVLHVRPDAVAQLNSRYLVHDNMTLD